MGKVKEYMMMENSNQRLKVTLDQIELPVKIKKLHQDAVIPKYAKDGDAGMDITCIDDGKIEMNANGVIKTYRTGIAVAIPEGYVGLIYPRSSIFKTGLRMCNSVGVIDSGYRGEILFKFDVIAMNSKPYKKGDRIGQIIITPYPSIEFTEVDELDNTERGDAGFGSTNEQDKTKNP